MIRKKIINRTQKTSRVPDDLQWPTKIETKWDGEGGGLCHQDLIWLNDLWSKKIYRPKMIIWSGATFILRWSCLIKKAHLKSCPSIKNGETSAEMEVGSGATLGQIAGKARSEGWQVLSQRWDLKILSKTGPADFETSSQISPCNHYCCECCER